MAHVQALLADLLAVTPPKYDGIAALLDTAELEVRRLRGWPACTPAPVRGGR